MRVEPFVWASYCMHLPHSQCKLCRVTYYLPPGSFFSKAFWSWGFEPLLTELTMRSKIPSERAAMRRSWTIPCVACHISKAELYSRLSRPTLTHLEKLKWSGGSRKRDGQESEIKVNCVALHHGSNAACIPLCMYAIFIDACWLVSVQYGYVFVPPKCVQVWLALLQLVLTRGPNSCAYSLVPWFQKSYTGLE